MSLQNLPLYNFDNGALMIGIFVLVCVLLVVAIALLMKGPSIQKEEEIEEQVTDSTITNQTETTKE